MYCNPKLFVQIQAAPREHPQKEKLPESQINTNIRIIMYHLHTAIQRIYGETLIIDLFQQPICPTYNTPQQTLLFFYLELIRERVYCNYGD